MPIDMTEIEELERLLEKATPQNIDTAEIKEAGWYECPWCNGQGEVEGTTYINYDNIASNVQFSGIGPEFGHAEALFRAVVKHLPSLLAEIKRGREILNTPELHDFSAGVVSEAQHQRERWGVDNDAGKTPADWFWLVGYLAGKALAASIAGNNDKALHHCISTAAALANWHAMISGKDSRMHPDIEPPRAALEGNNG